MKEDKLPLVLRTTGPEKQIGWAESYGPWILSICLHAILISVIFAQIQIHRANTDAVKHIRINFARGTPLLPVAAGNMARDLVRMPVPAGLVPVPPPPNPPSAPPAQKNVPVGPVTVEGGPQPQVTKPSTADSGDGGRGDVEGAGQEARIQKILSGYAKGATTGRQAVNDGRKGIRHRLEVASMQAAAYPHFPGYKGARVGAVRTLTFDNVSPEVAREVMGRYGIRLTTGYVMPSSGNYLSSASSGGSVYTSMDKPGYYDVFEIPPKACQQMAILEQNWLIAHGYDTTSTYVDVVEFGIIRKSENFWDLGILKMDVQQLAQLGHPSIAPSADSDSPTAGSQQKEASTH